MNNSLALEISKQYLKIVANAPAINKQNVFKCVVENIASLTDDQIAARITEILRREKLKPRIIYVSIPRDFVTVRNLHLPSQDNQEITQMIELHIARVVPYKKDEIVFTYKLSGMDEMGYARVILGIIQIDALRRQAKILGKSGYYADNVILSSYESLQWILKSCSTEINQNDLYAILDVDSGFTDFIVFSKTAGLMFTRSIPVGANSVAAKDDVGLMKLLGETKQSLIIFYNEAINKKPLKIFLTGARVIDNLAKAIENEMSIPVKLVPVSYGLGPLRAAKFDIPQDASMAAVSQLSVDKGSQSMNFVLPELQIKKALKEKAKDLIIIGSASLYLLCIICAIFWGRLYKQQAYLAKLKTRLGVIGIEAEDLIGQLKQTEIIKTCLYSRQIPLAIMSALQKAIPQEIAISSLGIDEKETITLRGQAVQLSDVFRFITSLEEAKVFNDIQTKYTRKRKMKEREITDFELSFQLAS